MALWFSRSRTIGYCLRKKLGFFGVIGNGSSCWFSPPFRYISSIRQTGGSYGNPNGFLSDDSATGFRFWRFESSRAETQLDAHYFNEEDDLNQVVYIYIVLQGC